MPNVTNTLTAVITSQEDTTGNIPINRGTGNPAFDSGVADFRTYYALPAGANSIPLPFSVITQLYIRNLDTAKSITVNWQANSGSGSVLVCILNPGDQIILFCNPVQSPSAAGIVNLVLTPSAAGAEVEVFLGN